jgi:non-ribosomal peptide synthetase component E (peptide arylation enzyme)
VLKALGIGRAHVVTIQLPNWIEFAFVFFALELIGAVANTSSPLPHHLSEREQQHAAFQAPRARARTVRPPSRRRLRSKTELRVQLQDISGIGRLGERTVHIRKRRHSAPSLISARKNPEGYDDAHRW